MEIAFSLRDVLEKNRQVTLPGIGSFHKKRIEGFFDNAKNAFFPPKEIIEFTENQQETTAEQIISYISNSQNISEISARYILKQYTDDLKNTLSESGEVPVKDLGTLKHNGEHLILEQAAETELSSQFFGLPSVDLTIPEVIQEKPKEEPVAESFSLAEQAMSVAVTENADEEKTRKPRTLIYILLFIIILLLGWQTLYLTRPDIIDNFVNNIKNTFNNIQHPPQDNKTILPAATADENEEKAIADSIYSNDIEQQLKEQGFEVEKVKDSSDIIIHQEQIVPKGPSIRYEIIISAWRTETKAKSELSKLRQNGIDAHIVDDADGLMIKISAASFYNKEEAERELKRIREELNPEAFIKPIRLLK